MPRQLIVECFERGAHDAFSSYFDALFWTTTQLLTVSSSLPNPERTLSKVLDVVLDAAPDRFAGSASGVNNAVARAAGLLSVAIIPGLAGIAGDDYAEPAVLDRGFHIAITISAGLLVVAAVVSFAFIRRPRSAPATERVRVEECFRCELTAPAPHPADR
jgi:hypothetical protein